MRFSCASSAALSCSSCANLLASTTRSLARISSRSLRIALGLGGLALQRIHLPRDFLENVIHAGQVQLGVFQARFGQPLLGLELGDAGGLFDDGAAIRGTAAQDLPDASLLDQGVGFRPQAGPHEQFLNIAQAAQLAVQQVFAVAGAEQAAGDHDLARVKLLLVELAAANLQHDLRRRRSCRRSARLPSGANAALRDRWRGRPRLVSALRPQP